MQEIRKRAIKEFAQEIEEAIERHICPQYALEELVPKLKSLLIGFVMPKNLKFKKDDVLEVDSTHIVRHVSHFDQEEGVVYFYGGGRSSRTFPAGQSLTKTPYWKEIEE